MGAFTFINFLLKNLLCLICAICSSRMALNVGHVPSLFYKQRLLCVLCVCVAVYCMQQGDGDGWAWVGGQCNSGKCVFGPIAWRSCEFLIVLLRERLLTGSFINQTIVLLTVRLTDCSYTQQSIYVCPLHYCVFMYWPMNLNHIHFYLTPKDF